MGPITKGIFASLLLILGYWISLVLFPAPWSLAWLANQDFYYELTWNGQKTGFVVVSYKQDEQRLQVTQSSEIKVINQGRKHHIKEYEILTFDKSSQLLAEAEYYRSIDEQITERHLKVNKSGQIIADDNPKPLQLSYSIADHLALMRWINTTPEVGEKLQLTKLDLSQTQLIDIDYLVLEKSYDNYLLSFKHQGSNWQGTVGLNLQGTPVSYQIGERIEQQLTTKEQALSFEKLADYYLDNIVKLDKPIGDINAIEQLTLNVTPEFRNHLKLTERQSINAQGQWVIASQVNSKSNQPDADLFNNEPVPKYLTTLAQNITRKATTNQQKLRALLNFVSSYLEYTPVIKPMTIDQILAQKQGDCTEHTRLFNALASSIGIKSRERQGLLYLGDELQGFGGHVWSEVWVNDQWHAVDATLNLTQLTAAHIELDEMQLAVNQLKQMSLVAIKPAI